MTCEEFSLEFDLLYNNIMSNKAPGLSEYEKSLFLTQAQESIVLDIYSGKYGDSFERTEETKSYLNILIKQKEYIGIDGTDENSIISEGDKLDTRSVFITLPEDLWFRTGETATIIDDSYKCHLDGLREVTVLPVTQDTFVRTKRSPFRGPNERRILRLDSGKNQVELISNYEIHSYTVRYLSRPEPIILKELPQGLTIGGKSSPQTCLLNTAIHKAILSKAVLIAKSSWESENNKG